MGDSQSSCSVVDTKTLSIVASRLRESAVGACGSRSLLSNADLVRYASMIESSIPPGSGKKDYFHREYDLSLGRLPSDQADPLPATTIEATGARVHAVADAITSVFGSMCLSGRIMQFRVERVSTYAPDAYQILVRADQVVLDKILDRLGLCSEEGLSLDYEHPSGEPAGVRRFFGSRSFVSPDTSMDAADTPS